MSELTEGDRYLLDEIREGRSEGWSQLVGRHQGRLLAFARGQLGNVADAEDAVQETFLSFLRGLDRFREEASVETYLFTILRRKIVDTFRGRPVNVCSLHDTRGPPDDDAGGLVGVVAAPDHTASWHARRSEDAAVLRDALQTALREVIDRLQKALDFRNLQIAELLFYAQLRNRDIAARLSVDEKQVALVKHRILKKISADLPASSRGSGAPSGRSDASVRDGLLANEGLLTQVWEQQRSSCPKRSTIGAFLLGTLDPEWHEYIEFHVHELGCRFCVANLDDIRQQSEPADVDRLRKQIMKSTVGFFRASRHRHIPYQAGEGMQ